MKKCGRVLAVFVLFSYAFPLFAQTSGQPTWSPVPEPYREGEIPSWAKDLQRSTIITLGSLPFTTLGSTLVYGLYKYIESGYDPSYSPNPFAAGSLTANEQIGIISTALGISLAIGLTDVIITAVKRKNLEKRRIQDAEDNSVITIEPVAAEKEATTDATADPAGN